MNAHFILYVADQKRSADFYRAVLGLAPRLDVPGMTEFELAPGCVLGLMPEAGIRRLLPAMSNPADAKGVPRAELYLLGADADAQLARAKSAGAKELSPMLARDWGHAAAYFADPDGHVVAFAKPL